MLIVISAFHNILQREPTNPFLQGIQHPWFLFMLEAQQE
jgi:hypothetical protein